MRECIGLFGTCGNSKWRDRFIEIFDKCNMNYFNPLVDDWKPEDAIVEAEHLATDDIILFPITRETYGVGSLSEVGFGLLNAININSDRYFVVMIETELVDELMEQSYDRAKESIRARELVLAHLRKLNLPNIYLVESFDEMEEVTAVLYDIMSIKECIEQYSLRGKYELAELLKDEGH